ncbi:hypothetical protein F3Y22_tig00111238pilonHSYRG00284 [Hibiscus syriacus]|uniref:Ysc84 actin-binding domain-containing protein n=1 Tax=Hibiscus syriacus TaxID=106335 RepID=A0A6A2YT55_HIBSY|nr:hypothetical protein F3Y22_tig00111238pilonHSYRG00284 [Hibiscus syriacus]
MNVYQFPAESDDFIDGGYDSCDNVRSSMQNGLYPEVNLKNVLSGLVAIVTGCKKGSSSVSENQQYQASNVSFLGSGKNGDTYLHPSVYIPSAPPLLEPSGIDYSAYKEGVLINTISNAVQVAKHDVMDWTCTRVGTGLVIARRSDGTWSAPSALLLVGLGWGAQIGGELMDFIIVLHDSKAVKTFCSRMHFSLGAGCRSAAGPVGRVVEADLRAGDSGSGMCYTYSCSKGAFVAASLEGNGYQSTVLRRSVSHHCRHTTWDSGQTKSC